MFYLTLPSNSYMNYFPDNTLTNYTTRLPQMIDLDGSWEVGVAEIQYPHTWYNVEKEEGWVAVHFEEENGLRQAHIELPEGYYSSAKRLCKAIETKKNETELKKKFSFTLNEVNHKVFVQVKDDSQSFVTDHVRI